MKPGFLIFLIFISVLGFGGCSHSKTKPFTLSQLQNKKVAIGEIDAEKESKKVIEIGIINEIIQEGRFEVIDRTSVQEAKTLFPAESDFQKLGQKVGADYILQIKIKEFSVVERAGLDREMRDDSVLAEENGEPGKKFVAPFYKKVKSYTGKVTLSCTFLDVVNNRIEYSGVGSASEVINTRDLKNTVLEVAGSGKWSFLESLTQKAFADFFSHIQK